MISIAKVNNSSKSNNKCKNDKHNPYNNDSKESKDNYYPHDNSNNVSDDDTCSVFYNSNKSEDKYSVSHKSTTNIIIIIKDESINSPSVDKGCNCIMRYIATTTYEAINNNNSLTSNKYKRILGQLIIKNYFNNQV